jgi:hypothetical protein
LSIILIDLPTINSYLNYSRLVLPF